MGYALRELECTGQLSSLSSLHTNERPGADSTSVLYCELSAIWSLLLLAGYWPFLWPPRSPLGSTTSSFLMAAITGGPPSC